MRKENNRKERIVKPLRRHSYHKHGESEGEGGMDLNYISITLDP